MKIDKVPQDESSTYKNFSRVMYATDSDGDYTAVVSNGWETEEFITKQALSQLEEQTQEAIQLVQSGEKSILYFHMCHFKYNITTLAQSAGIFQWRVRRHMNPKVYKKLSEKILMRYASAFNLPVEQLKNTTLDTNLYDR